MHLRHIHLEPNYECMSQDAASFVIDAIAKKPDLVLCLSAGDTPKRRIALDVEDCLLEFSVHRGDGFERIVFEDLLTNFVPNIFLRIELRRIGRKVQQRDVVRNDQHAAPMVGSPIEHEKDILSSELSCQRIEEGLEASGVRRRHDQIHAASVLGGDGAVQIDVFADQLGGHFRSGPDRHPARSGPIDATKSRFVGEHDAQTATPPGGGAAGFVHSMRKAVFLKASCAARWRLG